MRWMRRIARSAALAVVWAGPALAQDITVHASVDRSQITIDDAVRLAVTVTGTQSVPVPTVEAPDFSVRYVGPSTAISITNGQMVASVTHVYSLVPQREGHFTIGPITVQAGGKSWQTEPVELDVVGTRTQSLPPGPGSPSPLLRLQMALDKNRAYVNEVVPARVQLLVGRRGVRQVEMPTIQSDGLLVRPVSEPVQSDVSINNDTWSLLEFQTTVVPLRPGTATFGPAGLRLQLAVRREPRRGGWAAGQDPFEGFFGEDSPFDELFGMVDTHPVTLSAESASLEVLPLPEEGRPADFAGAVGQFVLDVAAVPSTVTVGEPITLTMTVRGQGNFDTVTSPVVAAEPNRLKTYEPKLQPTPAGSDAREAQARKVFEQVVIPLEPSMTELPPIRFSYFDPATGRYETITKGPIAIAVMPGAAEPPRVVDQPAAAPSPSAPVVPESLGRDIVDIKERLGSAIDARSRWFAEPWWLWWLLSPVMVVLISEWFLRRQHWIVRHPEAVRAGGALRRALAGCQSAARLKQAGRGGEFYTAVFRVLQGYLGDRLGLTGEGMTRQDLERHLRQAGVPDELIGQAVALLDRCDAARFAPASTVAGMEMEAALRQLESLLLRLEKWKSS